MKINIKWPILSYNGIILYSLLGVLTGIFLWPQLASLSAVSAEKIVELTNKERDAAGFDALTTNRLLAEAAHAKGIAILSSGIFQHNIGERKFSDWIREAGYEYSYVGENLAMDFVTGEGAIRAWMRSETHRKNILNAGFN